VPRPLLILIAVVSGLGALSAALLTQGTTLATAIGGAAAVAAALGLAVLVRAVVLIERGGGAR
jgi:hypothetical protein